MIIASVLPVAAPAALVATHTRALLDSPQIVPTLQHIADVSGLEKIGTPASHAGGLTYQAKEGKHPLNYTVVVGGPQIELKTASTFDMAPGVQAEIKEAVFDPEEAGRRAVRQLREAEGGAWTGAELLELHGLTSATLYRRRSEHRILAWRDAKNQFFYPKWQFTPAGTLLPGLQEVLRIFHSPDEWRVMLYFLAPRHQLDDRTPLDLLRVGETDRVIAHAKAHGEENSW